MLLFPLRTKDKARYSFLVPAEWTEASVTKVEKGTNGTDSRFESGARSKCKAYVVTLARAGEDYAQVRTVLTTICSGALFLPGARRSMQLTSPLSFVAVASFD